MKLWIKIQLEACIISFVLNQFEVAYYREPGIANRKRRRADDVARPIMASEIYNCDFDQTKRRLLRACDTFPADSLPAINSLSTDYRLAYLECTLSTATRRAFPSS